MSIPNKSQKKILSHAMDNTMFVYQNANIYSILCSIRLAITHLFDVYVCQAYAFRIRKQQQLISSHTDRGKIYIFSSLSIIITITILSAQTVAHVSALSIFADTYSWRRLGWQKCVLNRRTFVYDS